MVLRQYSALLLSIQSENEFHNYFGKELPITLMKSSLKWSCNSSSNSTRKSEIFRKKHLILRIIIFQNHLQFLLLLTSWHGHLIHRLQKCFLFCVFYFMEASDKDVLKRLFQFCRIKTFPSPLNEFVLLSLFHGCFELFRPFISNYL